MKAVLLLVPLRFLVPSKFSSKVWFLITALILGVRIRRGPHANTIMRMCINVSPSCARACQLTTFLIVMDTYVHHENRSLIQSLTLMHSVITMQYLVQHLNTFEECFKTVCVNKFKIHVYNFMKLHVHCTCTCIHISQLFFNVLHIRTCICTFCSSTTE